MRHTATMLCNSHFSRHRAGADAVGSGGAGEYRGIERLPLTVLWSLGVDIHTLLRARTKLLCAYL